MKIQPLGKKIAVVKLKGETQTEAGIILTKGVDSIDKAKIVAIGTEVKSVVVGETVLVNWNKATASTIDNIPIYMLTEDDVVAVFD
jgi:co-chaperonin GroES (HSP10)